MIEIAFDNSFKKAFKKRIAGNSERENNFRSKIEAFRNNPFEPNLKTHKLSGKLKYYWSFTVEYDLRVIFYFDGKDKAVFLDIGTHKEVY